MTQERPAEGLPPASEPIAAGNKTEGEPASRYDGFLGEPRQNLVKGWLVDHKRLGEKLTVEVLVDGAPLAPVLANEPREHLQKRRLGDGCYGFTVPLPPHVRASGFRTIGVRALGETEAAIAREVAFAPEPAAVVVLETPRPVVAVAKPDKKAPARPTPPLGREIDDDPAPSRKDAADKGEKSQVAELALKYQNGFATKAREDLVDIFGNLWTPARKRQETALALVNCLLLKGDDAERVDALLYLDFLEDTAPDWLPMDRLLLKVEALTGLGRLAEAQHACIRHAQKYGPKSVVALAMSNALERGRRTATALKTLNAMYAASGLAPVALIDDAAPIAIDNLTASAHDVQDGHRVCVIIPVFNGAANIDVCLRSLSAQTWRNLEILVCDDASADETAEIVMRHAAADDRIRLLRNEVNSGPYAARNLALADARGDFVTVQDADDWAHPQKIEDQARQLIANPRLIGNLTSQLRVDTAFKFERRGRRTYAGPCLASFMFRRNIVTRTVGVWDPVRFGADAEFIARIALTFGEAAIARNQGAPLTIMHLGTDNLTGSEFSRYQGFKMGARKEYEEASVHWHSTSSDLRVDSDPERRAFAVPAIMRPGYRGQEVGHLDVIIASDFRLTGGTNQSNIQEMLIQKAMGVATGVVQVDRYDVAMSKPMSAKVRDAIDGDLIRTVTYGETVTCDLLIVRHPPVLNVANTLRPVIRAKNAVIVVNEPPTRAKENKTQAMYDPRQCEAVLSTFATVDGEVRWAPIGPIARDAFAAAYPDFPLSETWVNVLDFAEWPARDSPKAGFGTPHRLPVVGRHSRDQYTKWPELPEHLAQAYVNDRFETHVLGGADTVREVLGRTPETWTVHPFDGVPVQNFLKDLDFFVYFTHSQWDEAFGRTILEALAVGLPVIADAKFGKLFGDALLYAEPQEVDGIVRSLWADPAAYMKHSRAGAEFVRANFSTAVHEERIRLALRNA